MKAENVQPEDLQWVCRKCSRPLEIGTVSVEYMSNQFTTELPACPDCGFVLISEAVALGKMAEVEQILEDK
jgi:DNA-directed RNA polymerase subunit RPC12/RpoP